MKSNGFRYLTQTRTRRLPGYDYSKPGGYFITTVTENRECHFGKIIDSDIILSDIGQIVREEWLKSIEIRNEIDLDCWVIMPNHVHGVVHINDHFYRCTSNTSMVHKSILPRSLSTFVSGFKSAVSRRI